MAVAMLESLIRNPLLLIYAAFVIWMLVDAVRRGEWLWVVFIILFHPINAPLYFFLVYRNASSGMSGGFELPGTHKRKRIRELETQIRLLDKAHHYLELGDIYYGQGNLEKAHSSYQSALERDPDDLDVRGHLGQCLLRLKRPGEARALLETACRENPKHDYGHSLMGLAEAYAASGDYDAAVATLRRVLQDYTYARARVQLAEIYLAKQQKDLALPELREVLNDDLSAPAFQRKRDRVWVRRAKQLLR